MNLCNIAAISALVALSFGFSVLSVLPFIRPLPHAYCIVPIAYSEILSKSLYESMFVYSWAVGDADCLWQSFCDLPESGDEKAVTVR